MSAYRRIFVAYDGSEASARGLKEAIRLAKAEDAQLFIYHAVNEFYAFATPEGAWAAADVLPQMREQGRKTLTRAQALADKAGVRTKTVMEEKVGSAAAESILAQAKKQRADLIVLGTHGRRGLRRMVMGSDAEEVVRSSPVPVLLVRA